MISDKQPKISAIQPAVVRFLRHTFTAHAQKRIVQSLPSEVWPYHSLRDPRLPITWWYFHYRTTLLFCDTSSSDPATLTFALVTSWDNVVAPFYDSPSSLSHCR